MLPRVLQLTFWGNELSSDRLFSHYNIPEGAELEYKVLNSHEIGISEPDRLFCKGEIERWEFSDPDTVEDLIQTISYRLDVEPDWISIQADGTPLNSSIVLSAIAHETVRCVLSTNQFSFLLNEERLTVDLLPNATFADAQIKLGVLLERPPDSLSFRCGETEFVDLEEAIDPSLEISVFTPNCIKFELEGVLHEVIVDRTHPIADIKPELGRALGIPRGTQFDLLWDDEAIADFFTLSELGEIEVLKVVVRDSQPQNRAMIEITLQIGGGEIVGQFEFDLDRPVKSAEPEIKGQWRIEEMDMELVLQVLVTREYREVSQESTFGELDLSRERLILREVRNRGIEGFSLEASESARRGEWDILRWVGDGIHPRLVEHVRHGLGWRQFWRGAKSVGGSMTRRLFRGNK